MVTGEIRRAVKRLHTGDAVRATQSRRCFEGALVLRALTARAPQPRPEDAAPVAGGDPGSLRFAPGACSALLKGPRQQTDAPPRRVATPAAFADAPPRQPQEAFARAAPQLGADFSSPNVAAQWKLRGLESSQRTPESPTRCALHAAAQACYMLTPFARRPPLTSEDSEGPDSGQYSDVNQLLRSLHFERLLRLQTRSPQLQPSEGPQARLDAQQ